MVERMLVGLLARGHLLLEGVPGVAKTLAVRTLADITGGSFPRLQFTPDLMPGDIVGTRVWRPSSEAFDTELGPVFANMVLADEINRAPAKVQSALLEAMAEGQVSIGGTTYHLPQPFLVLATQNPIESEGVYQLPEAQRDRFLMKVDVFYPDEAQELAILQRMSVDPPRAREVLTAAQVLGLQAAADRVFVHHAVAQYAVALVDDDPRPGRRGCPRRPAHRVRRLPASDPRAGRLGPCAGPDAGRDYVLPRDVADVAADVMAHRLVLSFDASPRASTHGRSSTTSSRSSRSRRSPRTTRRRSERARRGMRTLAESSHAFAALDLTVRKRLAGLLNGDHEGLRLGSGSDADEVVRYRPGEDDVRRIDWNVTARSAETHVWRTRAQHEVETWVLVDETASMDFGTVEVEKGELAAWVTGAVGLLSDGPGNRMGVATSGDAVPGPAVPAPPCCRSRDEAGPAPTATDCASPRAAAVGLGGRSPCSTRATGGRACGSWSRTSWSPTAGPSAPSPGSCPCAASPSATTCSSSRWSTRASSPCPTSAPSSSSIPRPATGARSGPRCHACARSTPPSRPPTARPSRRRSELRGRPPHAPPPTATGSPIWSRLREAPATERHGRRRTGGPR